MVLAGFLINKIKYNSVCDDREGYGCVWDCAVCDIEVFILSGNGRENTALLINLLLSFLSVYEYHDISYLSLNNTTTTTATSYKQSHFPIHGGDLEKVNMEYNIDWILFS